MTVLRMVHSHLAKISLSFWCGMESVHSFVSTITPRQLHHVVGDNNLDWLIRKPRSFRMPNKYLKAS